MTAGFGEADHTYSGIHHRAAPFLAIVQLLRERAENISGASYNAVQSHQWLTEDVGDPMLAQHLHSLMMFQRLAIANGYGWQRFLHMVDQVLPRRGNTLELPLEFTGDERA
jgi:hypothetical protein